MEAEAATPPAGHGVDHNGIMEIEYKVEKIVSRRIYKNKLQYEIKWAGYPHSDNTWEDADQLDIFEIIEEFEKTREKSNDTNYDEYDFENEQPTSEKRRGRPPKKITASATKSTLTPAKNETPSNVNGDAVKRGRGRPPKSATTTPKMNGHGANGEPDTLSLTHSLPSSELISSEASKSARKRGRPPKSASKTTADAIVKKAKTSPKRRSLPSLTAQSSTERSPTKASPTENAPSDGTTKMGSLRLRLFSGDNNTVAKPVEVIGLQLNGQNYQYLVKCHGETKPRKFSSTEAKNEFPNLIVDYYEKTAVVSAIKIDQTIE
uniref:Chromo domain-containing protein n=1 Tax=Plectus sambesii TaxID=2011161 RepID=A0A914VXW5_9BILA